MSPNESGARQPVRRAVSAILRQGTDGPRPVEELDAVLDRPADLSEALAAELRGAAGERLAAVIHLVKLVRADEVLDIVAETALETPATLEAKERALEAFEACDRPSPEGARERLREARSFAARAGAGGATAEGLDRVLSWPDAWRVPTLRAWLSATPTPAAGGILPLVRRALGHTAAIDLLLLDWLGEQEDPAAAGIVADHAANARERQVTKAAKRALHRLRSRGIDVEEPRRQRTGGFSLAVESDALGESRAWWTSHDGSGARIVWVLWPSPSGGSRLLQAVVGEEGLEDAESQRVTRGDVRRYVERLQDDSSLLMERIDPRRAASVLARGARRSEERGVALPAAYREWRESAGSGTGDVSPGDGPGPDDAGGAPSIRAHVAEEEVRGAAHLVDEAVELLREPFLASWAIRGEVAERAAERIRQAEESKLLVDDEQRRERVQDAIRSAVTEAFDDDTRQTYRRRLEELAGMLWRQGRQDAARRLLAAGVGLTEMGELFARHAFARALVHRGVWLAYKERRQREAESDSRIVRP